MTRAPKLRTLSRTPALSPDPIARLCDGAGNIHCFPNRYPAAVQTEPGLVLRHLESQVAAVRAFRKVTRMTPVQGDG